MGALSRYGLTRWATEQWGTAFPFGTLMVNLSGSGLMGLTATLLSQRTETLSTDLSALHLLLVVGFLGSYTTFSTYVLDLETLFRQRESAYYAWDFLYGLGSLLLGFLCLELGVVLAKGWLAGS